MQPEPEDVAILCSSVQAAQTLALLSLSKKCDEEEERAEEHAKEKGSQLRARLFLGKARQRRFKRCAIKLMNKSLAMAMY